MGFQAAVACEWSMSVFRILRGIAAACELISLRGACVCHSRSLDGRHRRPTGLLLDSLSADLICKRNSNTLYTLLFNYVVHCSKSLHSYRRTTSSSAGKSLHLPITPCHGFKLYKLSLLLNLYYKRAVAVKCCKCSAPIATNFVLFHFYQWKSVNHFRLQWERIESNELNVIWTFRKCIIHVRLSWK